MADPAVLDPTDPTPAQTPAAPSVVPTSPETARVFLDSGVYHAADIPAEQRFAGFVKAHALAGSTHEEIDAQAQQTFPEADLGRVHQEFGLEKAREKFRGKEESPENYFGRHVLPGVATGRGIGWQARVNEANKAYQEGRASPGDLDTLAEDEWIREKNQQYLKREGLGVAALHTVAGIVPAVGEMAMGPGKILKAAVGPNPTLLRRAATAGAVLPLTTPALSPVQGALQRAGERGGETPTGEEWLKATGESSLKAAVLGSFQHYFRTVPGLVQRSAAQGGIGAVEAVAAEGIAGALGLTRRGGKDSYGEVIDDVLAGKLGDANRAFALNWIGFTAFAAAHGYQRDQPQQPPSAPTPPQLGGGTPPAGGLPGPAGPTGPGGGRPGPSATPGQPPPVIGRLRTLIGWMNAQRWPADRQMAFLTDIKDRVERAEGKNPDLQPADVEAIFGRWPTGPARDFVTELAKGFPRQGFPDGATPPGPEVRQTGATVVPEARNVAPRRPGELPEYNFGADEPVPRPTPPAPEAPTPAGPRPLIGMSDGELRTEAASRGLPEVGSRKELLERLRADDNRRMLDEQGIGPEKPPESPQVAPEPGVTQTPAQPPIAPPATPQGPLSRRERIGQMLAAAAGARDPLAGPLHDLVRESGLSGRLNDRLSSDVRAAIEYPASREGESLRLMVDHLPDRNALDINFEYRDKNGGLVDVNKGMPSAAGLAVFRDLVKIAERAKAGGLDIHFKAEPKRAGLYDRGLRKAGYEKAAEQKAGPEGLGLKEYVYKPKPSSAGKLSKAAEAAGVTIDRQESEQQARGHGQEVVVFDVVGGRPGHPMSIRDVGDGVAQLSGTVPFTGPRAAPLHALLRQLAGQGVVLRAHLGRDSPVHLDEAIKVTGYEIVKGLSSGQWLLKPAAPEAGNVAPPKPAPPAPPPPRTGPSEALLGRLRQNQPPTQPAEPGASMGGVAKPATAPAEPTVPAGLQKFETLDLGEKAGGGRDESSLGAALRGRIHESASLKPAERDALLELLDKPTREAGLGLKVSHETVRKRANKAVEKLAAEFPGEFGDYKNAEALRVALAKQNAVGKPEPTEADAAGAEHGRQEARDDEHDRQQIELLRKTDPKAAAAFEAAFNLARTRRQVLSDRLEKEIEDAIESLRLSGAPITPSLRREVRQSVIDRSIPPAAAAAGAGDAAVAGNQATAGQSAAGGAGGADPAAGTLAPAGRGAPAGGVADPYKGQRIWDAVRKEGGLRTDAHSFLEHFADVAEARESGESTGRAGKSASRPGAINNKTGLTLERMHARLEDEGKLAPGTTRERFVQMLKENEPHHDAVLSDAAYARMEYEAALRRGEVAETPEQARRFGGGPRSERKGALALDFTNVADAMRSVHDEWRKLRGEQFPAMGRASEPVADAAAALISARAYAEAVTEHVLRAVFGDLKPQHWNEFYTAFLEMRLAYMRSQGGNAVSLIGPDSPLKTFQQYQQIVRSPAFRRFQQRWLAVEVPIMNKHYWDSQGLPPGSPIPTRTQLPGLPINLVRVRPGASGTAVGNGGTRQHPERVHQRPLGFNRRATGEAADGYETDVRKALVTAHEQGAAAAGRANLDRMIVGMGQGEWGKPGEKTHLMPDGTPMVPVRDVTPERATQAALKGETTLYVNPAILNEYHKAIDLGTPYRVPGLTPALQVMTRVAIASTVEVAYHSANLINGMGKPYVLRNLVTEVGSFLKPLLKLKLPHLSDAQIERVAGLAEIGATKPHGFQAGFLVPESWAEKFPLLGRLDPTRWTSQFLDTVDKLMRLSMDKAFDQMAKSDLIPDTVQNRRDFLNTLGQYKTQAQAEVVRLLRGTGFGPFATAATNSPVQAVRSLWFSPGVTAKTTAAQARLRLHVVLKLAAAAAAAGIINWLLWGNWRGDDDTPYGAIKLGEHKGRTYYVDPLRFLGPRRGLNVTGAGAVIEGQKLGATPAATLHKARMDVQHGLLHPAMGPGTQFAVTAATGENALGTNLAGRPEQPGGTKEWENFKAALKNANPTLAALMTADRVKPTEKMPLLPLFGRERPGQPGGVVGQYPEERPFEAAVGKLAAPYLGSRKQLPLAVQRGLMEKEAAPKRR